MLRGKSLWTLCALTALLAFPPRAVAEGPSSQDEPTEARSHARDRFGDPFAPGPLPPGARTVPPPKVREAEAEPADAARTLYGRVHDPRLAAVLSEPAQVGPWADPLSLVFEDFSAAHDIQFLVDRRALAEAELPEDPVTTLGRTQVPLRTALEMALEQHGLSWLDRDGVVWITTAQEAQNTFETRVYPVADLMPADRGRPDDAYGGAPYGDSLTGGGWYGEGPAYGGGSAYGGGYGMGAGSPARRRPSEPPAAPRRAVEPAFDRLVGLIEDTIEPASWEPRRGGGTIRAGQFGEARVLVIRQTPVVHEQVGRLLADLRAAAAAARH